jgi:anti-anti-sigma regulatory factor
VSAVEHLRLEKACTIAEAPARHRSVMAALASPGAALALDLSEVEQADVTLVQLCLAARASAARRDRAVFISAWSPAATTAFVSAGFPAGQFDRPSSL